MRILHVIRSLRNGGAENQLLKIVRNNNKSEWKIYIFLLEYDIGIPITDLPKNVVIVKSLKRFWPLNIFSLIYVIWRIKPDVTTTWMYLSCAIVTLLRVFFLYNAKIVWNIRSTELLLLGVSKFTYVTAHLLKSISKKKCDAIIYNSKASYKFHTKFGYTNKQSLVIENGLECHEFSNSRDIQPRFNRKFIVGSLGRFNEYKDYTTFIKAASLVASSNNDVHFKLGGYGLDSKNSDLMEIINKAGLQSDRYSLLGPVYNKKEFFENIDLFVLHSKSESFPNVLLEAIAHKTPCISTAVGDVSRLVNDERDILPTESHSLMANKIMEMIYMEPDIIREKCMSNFRLVEKFNIQKIVKDHEDLILKVSKE